MRKFVRSSTVLVVLAVTALAAHGQDPAPAIGSAGAAGEVEVTAKKFEFGPNMITVKQGDHVKLVVTALDRNHGFKLKAFDIDQRLKKGEPATIEFTADKAGTFPFQCSDFCGLGHGKMKGKLVVQPASNP